MTPKELGYYFPAEWVKHASTWLSYPHNENSWPDKIETIFPFYNQFIKELARGEIVNINILNQEMRERVSKELIVLGVDMTKIVFHDFKTNDAWARDHGASILLNNDGKSRAIVDWDYNAWGGKYPAELDNMIPSQMAKYLGLEVFRPEIVMEGGSVDFNGKGSLLTTTACLLNENRNPSLNQSQIEEKLINYYGVENVIWLADGVEGDDTDGHVDDITRFVNEDTVITVVEENKSDYNYEPLQENLKLLNKARLENGKQINVVELIMPEPVIWEDQRLPASYANFYIANEAVIVPIFNCKNDNKAIYTLEECFKDRKVIGIDSTDIIWGLGSFHCLSQQEPAL
ncbi:MAG: agmatine deiminase [Bacteroidetes bacterium]|nr:agmatine deiminase [Bacteroidota bacterium]